MSQQSTLHRYALALGLLMTAFLGTVSVLSLRSLHAQVTDDSAVTSSSESSSATAPAATHESSSPKSAVKAPATGGDSSGASTSVKKKRTTLLVLRPHCSVKDQTQCLLFTSTSPTSLETVPYHSGDTIDLDIVMQNPEMNPAHSIQAWLQYDPDILEGIEIIPGTAFPTVTPGKANFDVEHGYAMIQLSAPSTVTTDIVPVAEVTFTIKKVPSGGRSIIAFYDQSGVPPHTAIFDNGTPHKNLLAPSIASLSVLVSGTPDAVASSSSSSSSELATTDTSSSEESSSVSSVESSSTDSVASSSSDSSSPLLANADTASGAQSDLSSSAQSTSDSSSNTDTHGAASSSTEAHSVFVLLQVQNVRATTEGTSLYAAWDPLASPALQGYNVYYGTQPGRYIQRRTVRPEETSTAVRSLIEGTTYYLAIRGLGDNGEETAFSQEVAVKIGSPSTSTSPLYLKSSDQGPKGENPLTAHAGTTKVNVPESGLPSTLSLLLAASAVVGMYFAFRRQFVIPTHTLHD